MVHFHLMTSVFYILSASATYEMRVFPRVPPVPVLRISTNKILLKVIQNIYVREMFSILCISIISKADALRVNHCVNTYRNYRMTLKVQARYYVFPRTMYRQKYCLFCRMCKINAHRM